MKRTVVIGASDNPDRYSYLAAQKLAKYGHETYAVGIKNGSIGNIPLTKELKFIEGVDTVTMYVGPRHQPYWYDYVLSLKPKRIVFNPGAENAEFERMAKEKGIETIEACTLVMLSAGTY